MATWAHCPNEACRHSFSIEEQDTGSSVLCPRCATVFLLLPPPGSSADSDDPSFLGVVEVTTVGHYQIREKLGEGTFGVVYRAHDPDLDREVALKVLRPQALTSIEAVKRFLREARVAAKLQHH